VPTHESEQPKRRSPRQTKYHRSPDSERTQQRKRAEPESLWVDTPFVNHLREELARRDWIISDLARAIGSQTSLISRWMMGQRPNTESVQLIAEALGVDTLHLLVLSGHLKAPIEERMPDQRVRDLMAKLGKIQMTDERYAMLAATLDMMRKTTPTPTAPSVPHPENDRSRDPILAKRAG
jgi:transcriptional regulator with XRE-family HTH domain